MFEELWIPFNSFLPEYPCSPIVMDLSWINGKDNFFFIIVLWLFFESEGKVCWAGLTLSRTMILKSTGETNESALKTKKKIPKTYSKVKSEELSILCQGALRKSQKSCIRVCQVLTAHTILVASHPVFSSAHCSSMSVVYNCSNYGPGYVEHVVIKYLSICT